MVIKSVRKGESRMKAYVDPEKCISCGLCIGICGEVFEFNDEGISEAVGEITNETEKAAQEAADGCPTNAIIIE